MKLPPLLTLACLAFAGGCVHDPAGVDPWVREQGGLVAGDDARLARARAAFAPVAEASGLRGLTVDVVASADVNAFACPNGRVFVTAALLDLLADDGQVRAALAHEVGHLLARPPRSAALAAGEADLEAEARADAAADALLAGSGAPPDAMRRVLEALTRRRDLPAETARQLARRLELLRDAGGAGREGTAGRTGR